MHNIQPIGATRPGTEITLRAIVLRHVPEDEAVEVAIVGDCHPTAVGWIPLAAWVIPAD